MSELKVKSVTTARCHRCEAIENKLYGISNFSLAINKIIWLKWDTDEKINEIACKAHEKFATTVISKNINVAIEDLNTPLVRMKLFDEGMKKADVIFDLFLGKYYKECRKKNDGKRMLETKGMLLRRVKEEFRTTLRPHFDAAINTLCTNLQNIGEVASKYVSEQNGGRPIESIEFELPRPVLQQVAPQEEPQKEPQETKEEELDIREIPSTSRQRRLEPRPLPCLDDFMNFHNEALSNYFHDDNFGDQVDKNYRNECREKRRNQKR